MGNSSSSSRRRHNPYYPPPPPPPPYYYSTEAPLSVPLPPPPPPPPQQPPPPPSYPNNHPYQPSGQFPVQSCHPYNSSNYANHHHHQIVGRLNWQQQQPYYFSNNGWGSVGPSAGQQVVQPAPYVDHQRAKKVRNDVNLHKDSLKVEIDETNPDQHLVSFVFDALFDGSITIFYFAKEESNGRFVPLFPEAYLPLKIPFQKGTGQKFCQPSGTGIDLGFFELDDLAKPSPGEDVFPLVIVAETFLPDHSVGSDDDDDSVSNSSSHMQITQAVLEKKNKEPFQVRVIRQILWIDGVRYELRDIYGIGSSAAEGFDDNDPGKECVICMTEPKDTAVLPCRHMCMCSECAKELRLQTNKCPICRQTIEELIEIKIK